MGLSAFLSTQVIDTTSVGRSVMTAADAAAARLAIGAGTSSFDGAFSSLSGKPTTLSGYGITDAQPLDSDLTAIAALTTTTYGRSLLTGADAAATRTTLGLGTLATQSGTFSGTSSGTNTGDQTITLTGDVTGSGTGSFATTIANSAVTNAMLAGSIAISKLAITGTPDGTKFLRDDGTWAAASGGGSGITSLGGQTGSTQTFQTATTGTDFTISSSGNVHTFAIPDASASARGLVTTGAQTWAGQKTFAQGTLTSSAPLTLTQTWNSGATTFTGLLMNVTTTASASASLLMDLQVGGVSRMSLEASSGKLSVMKANDSGVTLVPAIAIRAPFNATSSRHISFYGSDWVTEQGYIASAAGNTGLTFFGSRVEVTDVRSNYGTPNASQLVAGGLRFASGCSVGWGTVNSYDTPDLTLFRDAANTLAQRNSTNAQTFNLANTYTSSTNFEYGRLQWASNQFRIGTAVGSVGGTQRSTVIGTWNAAGTFSSFLSIDNTGAMVHGGATFFGPPSGWTIAADNASGDATLTLRAGRTGNASGTQTINFVINSTTVFAANIFGTSINAAGNNGFALQTSGSTRATFSGAQGNLTLTPSAATSGSQTGFLFTAPAPTGQTASTEATMVNWNLASTVTFAAGALTTQRAFRIQAPTYAFASASTITTASTLSISGAPTAGTNATITNAYALNVEAGIANFAGRIFANGGSSLSQVSIGYSGFSDYGIWFNAGTKFSFGGGIALHVAEAPIVPSVLYFGDYVTRTASIYCTTSNIIEQRNSTNAQTFRVYNTYTSATNHEFLKLAWATNVAEIGTVKGSGGGTARNLALQTDNTTRISISGTTGDITITDAENIIFGTTTGTKLGTSTSEKLGFWNATPIVQPTTGVASATRTGGGGTALTDTDTYDGYTIAQVVKALRNLGVLA